MHLLVFGQSVATEKCTLGIEVFHALVVERHHENDNYWSTGMHSNSAITNPCRLQRTLGYNKAMQIAMNTQL